MSNFHVLAAGVMMMMTLLRRNGCRCNFPQIFRFVRRLEAVAATAVTSQKASSEKLL
jgi:hypothetical protein